MSEKLKKMSEEKRELISVIVPVYKVEPYLKKCVDSVLAQTYQNIEVILIDDGSPDGCGEICDEYGKKDLRIKVIHQRNAGISAARNIGVANAAGGMYCFVDSDDYLPRNAIDNLYSAMQEYDADISIGIEEYFRNNNQKEEHWKRPFVTPKFSFCMDTKTTLKELLRQSIISNSAWGKLYKKEVFTDVLFPVNRSHEPKATIYKTIMKAKTIAFCNEVVYYYLIRGDGFTREKGSQKKYEDLIWAIEKQCSEIQEGYPDLKKEADMRRLDAYFHAFINADKDESTEFRTDCWNQIKKYRRGAIFGATVRKKTRFAAVLSLLGPRLFTNICQILQ